MKLPGKRWALVAGALALVALALILWPREPESPEELIKQKVIQMARAAEKQDLAFVTDQISERFRGKQGWGKQEVKAVLAGQILRRSWVRVYPADLEVELLAPESARFSGRFVFGRSDAQTLVELPKSSVIDAYTIDGMLEKEEDGEWRFVSASHRQLDPSELF